jgi:putative zinc finger/helix-turn-helix YgiT family protein
VDITRCVKCGSDQIGESTEPDTLAIAGQTFTADVPALRCAACGAVFFDGPALGEFEHAAARELARHGPATGETFRFMRKALGVRAVDLAELLDVTPETISRWETGKLAMARTAWVTLSSLVLDFDGTQERLRAVREPPKSARVVRLKVPRAAAR